MQDNARRPLAMAALLLGGLLWGTAWMPLKYFAGHGMTGLSVTVLTYGFAGALALPWLWRRRQAWRTHRTLLASMGLLGGIANACFASAMMFGEVSRAMLLFYLVPVWGVLGGRLFFREAVSPPRAIAVALALTGAVLVLGGPALLLQSPHPIDLAALAAGFFYTAQNLCARAASGAAVPDKTGLSFIGCAITAAAMMTLAGQHLPAPGPAMLAALAGFTAVWLVVGVWTQLYGATHLEAGTMGVLVIFELLTAVVSAMVVGGERLDGAGWTGAALIVAAALIEARAGSRPPSNTPSHALTPESP